MKVTRRGEEASADKSSRRVGYSEAVLICCSACALIAVTWLMSRNLALSHDELWNYPLAIAAFQGDLFWPQYQFAVGGIPLPLVSGSYQGAIKSWLLIPILWMSSSLAFIRGINLLLCLCYMIALHRVVYQSAGRHAAMLILLLPFFDPNFLTFAPMDQGPFILQCIFFTLSLGAIAAFLRGEQRQKHLCLAIFWASAGLADKLTALPMALTMYVFLFVFQLRSSKTILGWVKACALLAVIAMIPLIPHAIYFWRSGVGELFMTTAVDPALVPPYLERVRQNLNYMFEAFSGIMILANFLSPPLAPLENSGFGHIGIILIASLPLILLLDSDRRQRAVAKHAICFTLLFVASFFAYSAFKGLNRPWHYLLLHPIFTLAACVNGHYFWQLSRSRGRWARRIASLGAAVVISACLISGAGAALAAAKLIDENPGPDIVSPAIYDLVGELQSQGKLNIVCFSYSLCNPIYVLSGGNIKIKEPDMNVIPNITAKEMRQWLRDDKTALVFRYSHQYNRRPQEWVNSLNIGGTHLKSQKKLGRYRWKSFFDQRGTEFGMIYGPPKPAVPKKNKRRKPSAKGA